MQIGLRHHTYTMFEHLFKKIPRHDSAAQGQRETSPPAAGETSPQANATTAPGEQSAQMESWRAKIQTAAGDDAALLQLAREAPGIDLKLVALQALTQEDSFKQAMREFGQQDKRLYRTAKAQWQSAKDRRLAAAEASATIDAARALLQQDQVAANHLVELERRWTALNPESLEGALPAEFAALQAQLGAKVREHGEQTRSLNQWLRAMDVAIETLAAVLPGVAKGDIPADQAQTSAVSVLDLLAAVPDAGDVRCGEKTTQANRQLALAASVAQRAQFLQALPVSGVTDPVHEKTIIEQWRAFPELADDSEAHSILAQRFADWRNAGSDARKREQDAHRSQERQQRAHQQQQRLDALQGHVEAAEAAHAAGRVAELAAAVAAIDQALKGGSVSGGLSGVLTQRIEFLRREQSRLQEWQRWSGGLGREQLVAEAQQLAHSATGSIAIKAHGEAINKLRERWKELDKLGAVATQSLWLSFDGALKSAYEPVAAHLDKLKRARAENLAARDQIITELNAAAAQFFPPAQQDLAAAADAPPDWRAIARTLEQARIAWQKLGPIEHTVPRSALRGDGAVTARYAAAVQALQAPLSAVYADARKQREQLIGAATDLAAAAATARDVVEKVKKLQTQWQSAAKALPLPRGDENQLWAAFKSGIDAVFAARDAARSARETESSAQLKAREEIIERLAAIVSSGSPPEIKRAMAEADRAWRAAALLPKALQAKLDGRYDAARAAARVQLEALAQHASRARFDDLVTAMALCHQRESAHDSGQAINADEAADLESRWSAMTNLPAAWKSALEARFRAAGAAAGNATSVASPPLLDALLNLETSSGVDSPAEFHAARQQLKMRALKSALEARQAPTNTPADIERWLLVAVAYPRPDQQSRQRLAKIIAALRLASSKS